MSSIHMDSGLPGVEMPTLNSEISPAQDLLERADQILEARYDFWIQTLGSDASGIEEGVCLYTFQRGRGHHITVLDTWQARSLGARLVSLADNLENRARVSQDGSSSQTSPPVRGAGTR